MLRGRAALEALPRNLPNHISTWRDAQEAAVSHHLGDTEAVKRVMTRVVETTIPAQIDASGAQPLEAWRVLAWKAHAENLLAFSLIAGIARHYEVDVWGAGVARAQAYLEAHAFGSARWPGSDAVDDYLLVEPLARLGEVANLGRISDQEKLSRERAALVWPWR